MKALTLQQPWASLMALGLKTIETRSWNCWHRGPLVIHSSAKWDRAVLEQLTLARRPPICDDDSDWRRMLAALNRAGVKTLGELPLGCALATLNVEDCILTEDVYRYVDIGPTEDEIAFGNYAAGRFAILTEGVRRFDPIPFKGRLGLWEFPDGLIPEAAPR
jgi:hypothetical protein